MKTVLFGGNNPTNIFWLESMKKELEKKLNDVFVHRYSHWDTNDELIDLNKELENLRRELESAKHYVIVGKSAGVLLVLKGISESKLHPSACVFLGIPVLWGLKKGFDINKWVKGFSVPTLFIQKSGDPAIAPDALKNLLKKSGAKNYKLHIIPGEEHEYAEYKELSKTIISFLKNQKLID